jgi:hypothetical protein
MRQLLVPVLTGLAWTTAVAHHSPAIFDQDREIVLEGVVSGYNWKYPHVYIFVDAEDDSRQIMRWQVEGDDPKTMSRSGWTATTLVVGDRVLVRAHPDRNAERHHALMVSLTTPDGTTLIPEVLDAPPPTVAAVDIFSLWDPSAFNDVVENVDSGSLTEKGAAAQAVYTEEDAPESQCVPPPPPATVVVSLLEIKRQEEHVLIRTEEFQIERIVYMDGREHPADGERTNQGHSIGWWDGDVLVVDTTHFADHLNGNSLGIPSGAQKHLVERFQLTEDRTQLRFDFVLEDPEYLREPLTGGIVLDHAPNETFVTAVCDPESARMWMYE